MDLKTFHDSLTGAIYDVRDLFGVLLGLDSEVRTDQDVSDAIAQYTIAIYWHVKDIIRPWVVAATDDDWRIVDERDIGSGRDDFRFLAALRSAAADHPKESIENSFDETEFAHLTISIRHEQMFDNQDIHQALGVLAFGSLAPSKIFLHRYDCCIHETTLNYIEFLLDYLWGSLIYCYSNAFDDWSNKTVDLHRRVIEAALAEDVSAAKSLRHEISETLTQTARQTALPVFELMSDCRDHLDKLKVERLWENIDQLCQELDSEMMRAIGRIGQNNLANSSILPLVDAPLPNATTKPTGCPIPPDGPIKPDGFRWGAKKPIDGLTPTEFDLLEFIFDRRDNPPTLKELKRKFWPDSPAEDGSFHKFASALRAKLAPLGIGVFARRKMAVIRPIQDGKKKSVRDI